MIRIKTLGLAVIAALSLCAIAGASTASAGYFSVSAGTTSYVGVSGEQYFTMVGGRLGTCSTPSFSGVVTHGNKGLAPSMSDMTCETSFEGPASWKMKGCSLTFTPGVEGAGTGTFAIGPVGCGAITLSGKYCTRFIAPQSGKATFTNESGKVKIQISNAALSTTVEKQTPQCAPEFISYTGSWTVVPSSGTLQVLSSQAGLFLGGSGFAAESYPVNLAGSQDPSDPHVLTLVGGRRLKCEQANLVGALTKSSAELSLTPQYANCQVEVGASKLPSVVAVGSCGYKVSSSGVFGISCTEAGDAVALTVYANATKQAEGVPLCVYRLAAQSGASGVGLSTYGEGSKQGVSLDFGVTSLSYEKTVGTIGNCGEKSASASYDGTSKVTASIN
jgi:hypothetical protein